MQFECFQFRGFSHSYPIGAINELSVANDTGTVSACFWPFIVTCHIPFLPPSVSHSLLISLIQHSNAAIYVNAFFAMWFLSQRNVRGSILRFERQSFIACNAKCCAIQMAIRRVGGPMHYAPLWLRECIGQKIMAKYIVVIDKRTWMP